MKSGKREGIDVVFGGLGIWDMGYGIDVRLGTKDTWPRGAKMRSSKVIRTSLPY